MKKFAPDQAGEPPTQTEGPTMIIKKAAAKAAETSPQPVVVPKGNPLPPDKMLGAVAYAYAKGVYRSEDIERKMNQDPKFREAVGNEVPGAKSIRLFRRLNREAILATLGKFLRWKHTQAVSAPGAPLGDASQNTQFFVKTEAEGLLDKAAWVDNMSKEE